MCSETVHPVPAEWKQKTWCTQEQYQAMYQRSLADPEAFWADQAKRVDWIKQPTKIKDVTYSGDVKIRWYYDGTLNISANCIDRHLAKRGNQTAIIWEGDD